MGGGDVRGRFFFSVISIAMLVACVLLLRQCLLDLGLPDGTMLETLAWELRSREVTAAEAVTAFYRELIDHGPS